MIEAFIGAPVVIDVAGLGSAAHRVRLFWTNWISPEILHKAIPTDVKPCPPLKQILNVDHQSGWPTKHPMSPFALHNRVGQERLVMPTIVSFPKSHAFRMQENGGPGEGQLWNKRTKKYEEPTLEEKKQLMGFKVGDTEGSLATRYQSTSRLGQAMNVKTMKWLGAFLYAQHERVAKMPVDEPLRGIHRIGMLRYFSQPSKAFFSVGEMHNIIDVTRFGDVTDHHHQACAIVENNSCKLNT